jgi:hypothetical protein
MVLGRLDGGEGRAALSGLERRRLRKNLILRTCSCRFGDWNRVRTIAIWCRHHARPIASAGFHFQTAKGRCKRGLRLRSACMSPPRSKSEHRTGCRSMKILENMVNAFRTTHVGRGEPPDLPPKYPCFLSLRSASRSHSSHGPEPDISSAWSEGMCGGLVACATGRTLVELFATTVARLAHACWRLE